MDIEPGTQQTPIEPSLQPQLPGLLLGQTSQRQFQKKWRRISVKK